MSAKTLALKSSAHSMSVLLEGIERDEMGLVIFNKPGVNRGAVSTILDGLPEVLGEYERMYDLLNKPEVNDFGRGVTTEAVHQQERWGTSSDKGKTPMDWFWLLGFLAGKALHAAVTGNLDKAKHHCISTAAACANWHAALSGTNTWMRPGIDTPPGEES